MMVKTWTTWWVLTLILNQANINPSKNLVFHDGYNFEFSNFNRKAFIKKKLKFKKLKLRIYKKTN